MLNFCYDRFDLFDRLEVKRSKRSKRSCHFLLLVAERDRYRFLDIISHLLSIAEGITYAEANRFLYTP